MIFGEAAFACWGLQPDGERADEGDGSLPRPRGRGVPESRWNRPRGLPHLEKLRTGDHRAAPRPVAGLAARRACA